MEEAHQMPQLTWGTEGMMYDDSDWSRAEEEEEKFQCPQPLEPNIQEFLRGEEMFLASAGVGDGLPRTMTPNDPKPPTMVNVELVKWCT